MAIDIEVEFQVLRRRVEELEGRLRHRDEQLGVEKDRCAKARKKIKQLLLKIQERDRLIGQLRVALEQAREIAADGGAAAAAAAAAAARASSAAAAGGCAVAPGVAGQMGRGAKTVSLQEAPAATRPGSADPRQLAAAQERAAIVAQLETHLAQMRASLASSERELQELQERRRHKEAEWNSRPEDVQPVPEMQVHWQTLGVIGQQIQEKRQFAAELAQKTKELEMQVVQQRALIHASLETNPADAEDLDVADDATGVEMLASPTHDGCVTMQEGDLDDEALGAFLSAAGAAAEVVFARPALQAAFVSQPPRLSAAALEGCKPEERAQALSLFSAWVAVAGDPPHSLLVSDVSLQPPDVQELHSTLDTCGAQLQEVEMTHCHCKEAICRSLLLAISAQPLRRLNLGYNALGAAGASALVEAAPAWSGCLEHLCLEMNGLSDAGCMELAGSLANGHLASLRVLELGWNELSSECAPALAKLLAGTVDGPGAPPISMCKLERLSLGGNRFGSEGACELTMGALQQPERRLQLDLSMNHVGAEPLLAVAGWAETCCSCSTTAICVNLEWNTIDDLNAVERAAKSLGNSTLGKAASTEGESGAPTRAPLLLVANNDELADLDPQDILRKSHGLIRV